VADHVGELTGERGVGVEHEVAGPAPGELVLDRGHRGHAVEVGEAREAEQPGLERVPALRDVVAGDHGVDEGLHRRVARLVVEVAAGEPPGVRAQSVVGRLVGEERVEHEGARAQAGGQSGRDRGGRLGPHRPVG